MPSAPPSPLLLPIGCLLAGLLSACTPLSRVVVLPQEGQASAVEVVTPGQNLRLSQAYGVAEVGRHGGLSASRSDAATEQQRHPQLLALQPPPEQRFVLLFAPGTSSLTPESLAQLEAVIAAARARDGGEIVVTGHTDRQGAADANDALSLRRAQAIRDLLVQRGFQRELVLAVGRGEREPVVPTDDGVAEPRNRRAEVTVR